MLVKDRIRRILTQDDKFTGFQVSALSRYER